VSGTAEPAMVVEPMVQDLTQNDEQEDQGFVERARIVHC
jgi:hypothetical protein